MLSMINRGRLDQPVQEEFEHLIGRLRGFLSQSFDEDGNLIVADTTLAVIPVGGITAFAGQTAPGGYLLCDGAQVSRQTYKGLFDVIGTRYGGGNGTTTFTVPDLRQRFPLGQAASGTGAVLGATGGAIDHAHTLPGHTHTVPAHTHPVSGPAPTVNVSVGVTVTENPHTHGFSAATTGATDNAGGHSHLVDSHAHSIPAHAHDYSGNSTTGAEREGIGPLAQTTVSGVPAANSPHTHNYNWGGTTVSGGNGSTGGTTAGTNSGGDHAHNVSVTLGGTTDPTTPTASATATATATASAITGTAGSGGGGATGDSGALATGPNNPPFVTVNYLIYAGV